MKLEPGFRQVPVLNVDQLMRQASQSGWTTFVMPSTGIRDRQTFFNAIRLTCPLDPPLTGNRSWDALSDSLWEGLRAQPSGRVALIWPNAAEMAEHDASEFETALSVLADVANPEGDHDRDPFRCVAILVEIDGLQSD